MADREQVNKIQHALNDAIIALRDLPEYYNDKAEVVENIIENIKGTKKAVGLLRNN